jgi:Ras-related protein Rab-1A
MTEGEKGNSYEYIFKLIVIGNSGVGKSSILQRYIQKIFKESYSSTIGVDFFMKSITIGDKSIKLQLWDTAGTEKFRSITTGYYRGADAAFVVFDLTSKSSFNNLNEWIESYYKYSNPDVEKNVVLIGNKCDLIEERKVTEEEIETFIKDNNIIYFETSAKDGKNIDESFTHIAEILMKQNENKENELVKRTDIIKNENLKENAEVIIDGKNKCCLN